MFEVSQQELVATLADELKSKIDKPDWSKFVKTGMHKERPPVDEDWWYMRAASVLRQVELKGPIGVSKLRYKYGGRKTNRGMAPEHLYKGSGKIIRTILQQLEEAKLVKQDQKGVHKGRVLTSEGKSLVFQTAKKLEKAGSKPKPKKSKKKSKKEEEKKPKEDKKDDKKSKGEGSDATQGKASGDKGKKESKDKKDEKKKASGDKGKKESKDDKKDSGDDDGEE